MSIYKKKQLFLGVVLFVSDSQKCTKRVFFPKEFLRGTTTVKYLEDLKFEATSHAHFVHAVY